MGDETGLCYICEVVGRVLVLGEDVFMRLSRTGDDMMESGGVVWGRGVVRMFIKGEDIFYRMRGFLQHFQGPVHGSRYFLQQCIPST